jgi:hypothetical protein
LRERDLREIRLGCNRRHLEFLTSLDDTSAGERDRQQLSQPRVGSDPSVRGLDFFSSADQALLRTMQRGEFSIHGWRRAGAPWATGSRHVHCAHRAAQAGDERSA